MQIAVQQLDENAKLPEYAHPGDAGMDLFSNEEVTLKPGERHPVATGIAMRVPDGHVALVWDKSGRAVKDGVTTLAGVIDAGYRGEVRIVLLNVSDTEVTIGLHEKVAQVLIQPVVSGTIEEVEALDDTERGEGGFGSTGIS